MAKKIFLSPSDQTKNKYAYGNTTEAVQCGKVATALKTALERCGFEVKLMHYYTMANKVATANSWGADLYIPIHSNAHDGSVSGTRLFCHDLKGNGYMACKAIFKYLAPVTPGKSENIQTAGYYEIKYPSAPTAYIETDFHDNYNAAKWLVENVDAIAEAICKGVCEYFGYTYKAAQVVVEPEEEDVPDVLYHVQVGAFRNKENAEALRAKLEAAGYDTFMKIERS